MDCLTLRIVDEIAAQGYYVGPTILCTTTTAALGKRLIHYIDNGALRDARVGRAGRAGQNTALRSDATLWLDDVPGDVAEADAVAAVHALRRALNQSLFVGAVDVELHYAHYPPGAFYAPHLDRFGDDDARIVSLIFYLNDDWQHANGGELVMYSAQREPLLRVLPRAGTMVAFLSERFPHEVLPATQRRLSLTGWMRRRAS
jgi:SM-20-related protein